MAVHAAMHRFGGPPTATRGVVFLATCETGRTSDVPSHPRRSRTRVQVRDSPNVEVRSPSSPVTVARLSGPRTPSLGRFPPRAFTGLAVSPRQSGSRCVFALRGKPQLARLASAWPTRVDRACSSQTPPTDFCSKETTRGRTRERTIPARQDAKSPLPRCRDDQLPGDHAAGPCWQCRHGAVWIASRRGTQKAPFPRWRATKCSFCRPSKALRERGVCARPRTSRDLRGDKTPRRAMP